MFNSQKIGPYSVSKTALLGLTKVLSQGLVDDKIRVNCVAPGVVETKSSRKVCSLFLITHIKWLLNGHSNIGYCSER